jgi:hypothetical protein
VLGCAAQLVHGAQRGSLMQLVPAAGLVPAVAVVVVPLLARAAQVWAVPEHRLQAASRRGAAVAHPLPQRRPWQQLLPQQGQQGQ